jgi:flotillin
MVLDALPKMAQPYADALGSIDDITVIDRDGASRLSGQVSTGVQELRTLLQAQTGIDLFELARGRGRQDDPTDAPTPSATAADEGQRSAPSSDDEVGAGHPS